MSAEMTTADQALQEVDNARTWVHAWITESTEPAQIVRLGAAYQHLVQATALLEEAFQAEQPTGADEEVRA